MTRDIPEISLQRLPIYLNYLKSLPEGDKYISSGAIAAALGMGEVLVRKDLAYTSSSGRPKVGYVRAELIAAIEEYLGCNKKKNAVLVGVGGLGSAHMCATTYFSMENIMQKRYNASWAVEAAADVYIGLLEKLGNEYFMERAQDLKDVARHLIMALSGMAEPLGAVVAYFILAPFLSPVIIGGALALTAGLMVYISLDELLPMAREHAEAHYAIIGVFAGMALMAVISIVI